MANLTATVPQIAELGRGQWQMVPLIGPDEDELLDFGRNIPSTGSSATGLRQILAISMSRGISGLSCRLPDFCGDLDRSF